MLIHSNDTIFLAMILKGLFAQCVILNRMFNKNASNAGLAWGSTFAQNATSSMMMSRRINITVINVESAERVVRRTSFTVTHAVSEMLNILKLELKSALKAIISNIARTLLTLLLIWNILPFAGCCYTNLMKESHICIERAMHHNFPVCFEYIFDTTKNITVLPCGHTMHLECVMQMEQHLQYSCPVCSRSYCDMSRVWERLDQEVASTAMPEMYQNKMVWILCNDCAITSEVNFHIVAHKCPSCKSYNTRQTRGETSSCSTVTEMVR